MREKIVLDLKTQMESTITERGQTAIPAALRKKYGMRPHMKLVWVDTGGGIRVVPVPSDPIKGFRGMFKGLGLTGSLLKDRREARRIKKRVLVN